MDETDAKAAGDATGSTRFQRQSAPVIKNDNLDRYNMDYTYRGCAIIVNNKKFDPRTGMGERNGTDVDAGSMYDTLSMVGFEKIQLYHDLQANDMMKLFQKVGKEDHSNHDCFVCVILSHGEEGYVYGTDQKIAMDELVAPFKGDKCISLAGKPKLFFIQACRGSKLDVGVTECDGLGEMESDEVEQRRIPTEADFLFAYSVVPGFYSWRNSKNGSWFIQAIVEVFKKHWKDTDLITMMTRVNRKIAYDFESNASKEYMSRKKQIPCITSMLTKDVFFYEKTTK